MRYLIITRMVAGHRRMISSTGMSGSMEFGVIGSGAPKDAHPSDFSRARLCAGTNSRDKLRCDNAALVRPAGLG
jgi:hypothetical protein